jgi:hypothetical protein
METGKEPTMQTTGYIVRETEAAVAFVARRDVKAGVKPLWVPKAKILVRHEQDRASVTIVTAQDGERVGIPTVLVIDNDFAVKVGILAVA